MSKTKQELVYEACDKLSSEGKKISVQTVLDCIPSIKSKSTVHPHLKSWREDKQARIAAQQESVVLSKEVHSVLANEVHRHVKLANDGWSEHANQTKAHRDEAIEDLKVVEGKYQASKARIEKLEASLIELRAGSEMQCSCLQKALDEEKLTNGNLTCRIQQQQGVIEEARIAVAKLQGVVDAQETQTLSLKKVNSELESRIQLLEEKLRRQDKQKTLTRVKARNRK